MIQLKQIAENLNLGKTVSEDSSGNSTVKLDGAQKKKLAEMVSMYNEYGKHVYRETSLVDVAGKLNEIADLAEKYALSECNEWIEANTVKRNMTELRKYNQSFAKLAQEVHRGQQELEALYEDAGRVLNRYFDIHDHGIDGQSDSSQDKKMIKK